MRIVKILAGMVTVIALSLATASPALASYTQANCYNDTNGYERCNRGYQLPPVRVALGGGFISGKVEAVASFPKSIGYQGVTYLSGKALGYKTNVCAAPRFDVRHEFRVNGASGFISWQGAGINVDTGSSSALVVTTSQNQNWNLSFRANYPGSVTHTYSIAVTCNGTTAFSGGSETIPLRT